MALKGDISDFDLSDIFQLIGMQRKSGVLTLRRGTDQFFVEFDVGIIRTLIQQRQSKKISFLDHLMKNRIIDLHEYSNIQRGLNQPDANITHLLAEKTALSGEQAAHISEDYVKMNLVEILGWNEGSYDFAINAKAAGRQEVNVALSVEGLLLECLSRLDELKRIHPDFCSLHVVLVRKQRDMTTETLNPDVARILVALDGKANLREVADSLGVHPYLAMESTADLIKSDYVQIISTSRSRSTASEINIESRRRDTADIHLEQWAESVFKGIQMGIKYAGWYPVSHPKLHEIIAMTAIRLGEYLEQNQKMTVSFEEKSLILDGMLLKEDNATFSKFRKQMKRMGIKSVTFLHGVNTEVLKKALESFIGRQSQVFRHGEYSQILQNSKINQILIEEIGDDAEKAGPPLPEHISSWGKFLNTVKEEGSLQDILEEHPAIISRLLEETAGPISRNFEERELQVSLLRQSALRFLHIIFDMTHPDELPEIFKTLAHSFAQLNFPLKYALISNLNTDDEAYEYLTCRLLELASPDEKASLVEEELIRNLPPGEYAISNDDPAQLIPCLQFLQYILEHTERPFKETVIYKTRNKLISRGARVELLDGVIRQYFFEGDSDFEFVDKLRGGASRELTSSENAFLSVERVKSLCRKNRKATCMAVVSPYLELVETCSSGDGEPAADALQIVSRMMDIIIKDKKYLILEEITERLIGLLERRDDASFSLEIIRTLAGAACSLKASEQENVSRRISRRMLQIVEDRAGRTNEERRAAVQALSIERDEVVVLTLVDLLSDRAVSGACAKALSSIGVYAVRPLVEVLRTNDSRIVRKAAMDCLIEIGSPVLKSVACLLNSKQWFVKRNALNIIGHVGKTDDIPLVLKLKNDPNAVVRKAAAEAIGRINGPDVENLLITFLEDRDINVRKTAIYWLGMTGSKRSSFHLLKYLKKPALFSSEEEDLNGAIIEALGELRDESVIDSLLPFVKNNVLLARKKRQNLLVKAAEALGKIGGKNAEEALQKLARSRSKFNREIGLKILNRSFSRQESTSEENVPKSGKLSVDPSRQKQN